MLGYSKREIKSTSFDNALMENPPLKYVYLSRTYRSSYITCMYICTYSKAVFWIRRLVQIRVRISRSVPLDYGSKSRFCSFLRVALKIPTKKSFFLLINYCRYTSVFIDNKSLRRHKTVEIKIFLNFLCVDGRIRIHTNNYGSGSGT